MALATCIRLVQEWRYRFARDVLTHLSEVMISAHPIKYSEILDIDKKIRDFEAHPCVTQLVPKGCNIGDTNFFSLSPVVTIWYRESCS